MICIYFSSFGLEIQQKIPFFSSWSYFDPKLPKKLAPSIPSFVFRPVCNADVMKALKQLKSSKSNRTGNLPANILKDIAEQISSPLILLTNLRFQSDQFPTVEKTTIVTPIYKAGVKGNMDNYRPISVLNNISKVIERLAYDYNQMYEHLEINNLITPHQFGFRRNRSTQQCIVNLTNTIRMIADQRKCSTALYMDLRKAFDTANHTCIIKKLPDFGIRNTELEWLTDYLFHRKQQVKIEGYVSDAQSITCGVPRGSILGALLFLLLISDLPSVK